MRKKEAELANVIRHFRKQYVGKGPERIKVTIFGNMILVYTEGNLTPVEKFISKKETGKQAVVEARSEMVKELYRKHFPGEIEEIVRAQFIDLFIDINIQRDTSMTVFIFDRMLVSGL
ncbi:DUF2294 domain-containing protein [Microaerobacter geothermalis]|nr:DUF2294 domain-containing protein [Microaerobacter geothermalis]